MRSAVQYILSLSFICFIPTVLAGQNVPSPFRYIETNLSGGLFGGYLWMDSGDLDLGPTPAPIFGGRFGMHFTGPISGEVDIAYSPSERALYSRNDAAEDTVVLVAEGTTDMPLILANAALRLQLTGERTWHDLAPFITAGGGVVTDISGTDELESELEVADRVDFGPGFAVSLGMGTDWFPTEHLSFRVDATDRVWRITVPTGFTRTGEEGTDWTHNFGLMLGASLHF